MLLTHIVSWRIIWQCISLIAWQVKHEWDGRVTIWTRVKSRNYGGMTALLKRTELLRAISSQLKTLCEVNYAAFILKHMWVPVCHCMSKFALFYNVKWDMCGSSPYGIGGEVKNDAHSELELARYQARKSTSPPIPMWRRAPLVQMHMTVSIAQMQVVALCKPLDMLLWLFKRSHSVEREGNHA